METKIPQTIQVEHEEIHEELNRAMRAGGKTAEAARAVMQILQPHMSREEELVAPALALLRPAAAGALTEETDSLLSRIAPLEAELPRMLAEHTRMVEALGDLLRAATEEQQPGFTRIAQSLIVHAQQEEEILYPAAILVVRSLQARVREP